MPRLVVVLVSGVLKRCRCISTSLLKLADCFCVRSLLRTPRASPQHKSVLFAPFRVEKEQSMDWFRYATRNFLTATLILLVTSSLSFAQTGTTSLHGAVLDKSGAVLVGAKVSLTNSQQGLHREASTNGSGEYDFLALPPGTYTLVVEMTGFRKHEQRNLQLLVNLPSTVNLVLEIGTTAQTVEVSADLETLNATDASIGNAFSETQVKELPLEGRNVPDLLSLQPGVAYTNNRRDVPSWDTRTGAVNGARSDQSNVTLDGVAVNDEGGHAFTSVLPVTLDSVQEFRVTTTNYNADEGGTSGAQVALVTKSGTNDFHGSLYEYHRNTFTSANDYFNKASQLANCTLPNSNDCNQAPKLIRNIFGGSFGGPIKKNRLFLFMNYEGTRRAEQTVSSGEEVPSLAMRDGVLQYLCRDPSLCPGGTGSAVQGVSGKTYSPAPGYYALGPKQLRSMDPIGAGPDAAAMA